MLTRALALVAAALISQGCLVLAVDRFYDDGSMTSDDRIVGSWKDAEDNVTATVETSEWRSYRISFQHPIETGVLTGYLFKLGSTTYLDLTVARGQDPGTFVVAGHTVARVTFTQNELTLTPLSYSWFVNALTDGRSAAVLVPERSQRDQVVLAAPGSALRTWLSARKAGDPVFGAPATFRKQP